jgi:ligand-binding sensor domain-containing protein/serine phosphatase RsbU (regulator of sigma subunit)
MTKFLYFLVFIFCIAIKSFAQDYNFKHYGQKQGLSNTSVKCIFQDSYGYLWFATQGGGVSRFDGTNFINYDKQDGLVGNDVICISEDKFHNLWIGTVDGVSKFDRKTFTNYTTENGLKENKVFHVLCDDDKIWISTFGGGIAILENNQFSYLNSENGLSSDKVFSVYKDKHGKYWIGTSKGGINIYNGKSFTVIKESRNFNSASAFCFYESIDGKLWIGTPGKGIYYIENNVFKQFELPLIHTDYISKITQDRQGNLWCATEHGVLKIYKDLSYKIFDKNNGISGMDISYILCDYQGEIWVSCFGSGIHKLTNEALSVYTKQHGLIENRVIALEKKGDGFLFSSTGGLSYFNNGQISAVSIPKEIGESLITSIFINGSELLLGTENKGLFVLNEAGFNTYKLVKNINKIDSVPIKNIITRIQKDNVNHTYWISIYGTGILKMNNNELSILTYENRKLPTNDIISIHYLEGYLWMGTIGNGLHKLNTYTYNIEKISQDYGISSNNIFSIGQYNSKLVVGSIDEGLFILEKNKFKNYTKKNGLLSNSINAIKQLSNNELWIGTDQGINKLIIDNQSNITSIKSYNDEDGLKASAIEQNAILDCNNSLYFGTSEGLVSYNLKEDIISNVKPKLTISGLLIKYSPLNLEQIKFDSINKFNLPINPVFNYKQNDLTFKFKALTTQACYYQFLLEGYDKDWSPIQFNNEAVFTNLSHGSYNLKIKAVNKYGIESEVVSYAFEITPPFYKRWWFYILCILTIIISIFVFIRYRTHKLIKEKEILENKVTARTLELKQSNQNLNVALEEIKDSINYAERIQSSILPDVSIIKQQLKDSFILFKPRDVVSGDFYWYCFADNKIFIACIDCTGHGVPGAFMSMIGNSLLNEIVLTKKITTSNEILSSLNKGIQTALKQNSTNTKDGMDMALCVIDTNTSHLSFAGANRELLLIRDGELIEYKPTKNAIGGFTDYDCVFKENEIKYNIGDCFYMSTDGYADQFGGPKGKKLMTKNFKEFLVSNSSLPIDVQKDKLENHMIKWMGNTYSQVDDILVIGFRL